MLTVSTLGVVFLPDKGRKAGPDERLRAILCVLVDTHHPERRPLRWRWTWSFRPCSESVLGNGLSLSNCCRDLCWVYLWTDMVVSDDPLDLAVSLYLLLLC